ncbi:MAG: hypothetical protein EXS38_11185 [Opitutus sp.]|nr:hypothetical protein [Opitutus sp.]
MAALVLGANFNDTNLKITLAGGTLSLSGTTNTFGTLNVTGASVLDFGLNTASVLNTNTVRMGGAGSLTVNNWVNLVDYFYAQNFTGATASTPRGATPLNQVGFAGYSNSGTAWQSWDRQITPAPEPATYGLCFVAGCLGLTFWQRRRAAKARA